MKPTRLLLGLCLAGGIAISPAQAQTVMRISIATSQDSHQGVAIDTFAREVERRTDGRYQIKTFYNGALGGEREYVEAVQMGTQELALSTTGPIPNFVPETKILDMPFLFRDKAHARAVLDGPIGEELLDKFSGRGFVALGWGENGFRHMTNNVRPVRTPGDLQGLKMRTMENPVHIRAYKALGIIPTPMAFPEVFTALQQGTVDGQENPLSIIIAGKFEQVQKYISLTGHVYSPCVWLMNPDAYAKLSDADKQAFREAAVEGTRANRERVDADDARGVDYLRKGGMDVIETVDKALFIKALAPANAYFEQEFGAGNIQRIRDFK